MRENPIGVFDSGVGGLLVLNKLAAAMPSERFIYLADRAHMPYGGKSEIDIRRAACSCSDALFAMNCKAIVIACNTATTVAVRDIRKLYPNRIVVGLEPAVRPCLKELGRRGYAVALVTPATAGSEKLKRLLSGADGKVIISPQPRLAELVENNIQDLSALNPFVEEILAPYKDAEAVILGCSHYSAIAPIITAFYGGNIKIYDGADGAVARLKQCLALADLCAPQGERGDIRFYGTEKGS